MEYLGIIFNFLWELHFLGAAFTYGYLVGSYQYDPDFAPLDRYYFAFMVQAFFWEIYWPIILLLTWWESVRPNYVNTPNDH